MPWTPFTFYSREGRKAIAAGVTAALAQVLAQWVAVKNISCTVENVGDGDFTSAQTAGWRHSLDISSSVQVLSGEMIGLAELLLPTMETLSDTAIALRQEACLRCLHAVAAGLSASSAVAERAPSVPLSERFRLGSGWSVALITVDGIKLRMILAPEINRQFIPPTEARLPRQKLPRLSSVMATQAVTLSAELGTTTLTIGDIKRLAPGDVVALDADLSQKITLKTQSGQELAIADLGAFTGRKALRLLPPY